MCGAVRLGCAMGLEVVMSNSEGFGRVGLSAMRSPRIGPALRVCTAATSLWTSQICIVARHAEEMARSLFRQATRRRPLPPLRQSDGDSLSTPTTQFEDRN